MSFNISSTTNKQALNSIPSQLEKHKVLISNKKKATPTSPKPLSNFVLNYNAQAYTLRPLLQSQNSSISKLSKPSLQEKKNTNNTCLSISKQLIKQSPNISSSQNPCNIQKQNILKKDQIATTTRTKRERKILSQTEVLSYFDIKGDRINLKEGANLALEYLTTNGSHAPFVQTLIMKIANGALEYKINQKDLLAPCCKNLLTKIKSLNVCPLTDPSGINLQILCFKSGICTSSCLRFESLDVTLKALKICTDDDLSSEEIIKEFDVSILEKASHRELEELSKVLITKRLYKQDLITSLLLRTNELISDDIKNNDFNFAPFDLCMNVLKLMANYNHIHEPLLTNIEIFALETCKMYTYDARSIKLIGEFLRCFTVIASNNKENSKQPPYKIQNPNRIRSLFETWPHQIDHTTFNNLTIFRQAHRLKVINSFELPYKSKPSQKIEGNVPSKTQKTAFLQLKELLNYTLKMEYSICNCFDIDIGILDNNDNLIMAIEIDGHHHFYTDLTEAEKEKKVLYKDLFRDQVIQAENVEVYHIPIEECSWRSIQNHAQFIREKLS